MILNFKIFLAYYFYRDLHYIMDTVINISFVQKSESRARVYNEKLSEAEQEPNEKHYQVFVV